MAINTQQVSYNVYISLLPDGPWVKVNDILLDDNPEGNSYTIPNLRTGVLYYIMVVGGTHNELGEWVPRSGQPITPTVSPGVELANPNMVSARTQDLTDVSQESTEALLIYYLLAL